MYWFRYGNPCLCFIFRVMIFVLVCTFVLFLYLFVTSNNLVYDCKQLFNSCLCVWPLWPPALSRARIICTCLCQLIFSCCWKLFFSCCSCWAGWDLCWQIAGPAGCGKTQFCLLMCAAAAMLHSHNTGCINGATIYVDTESAFSPHRQDLQ